MYLVEHQILKAELALKVLRPSYRMRTDIVQRFRDESRALWELSHPSFVEVHHAGEDPEIGPYMSMEVLRGKTLAHLLAIKGRLTIEEALPIVIEAAEAAQVMRDLGILHRDLKPDNIFITTRDTPSRPAQGQAPGSRYREDREVRRAGHSGQPYRRDWQVHEPRAHTQRTIGSDDGPLRARPCRHPTRSCKRCRSNRRIGFGACRHSHPRSKTF